MPDFNLCWFLPFLSPRFIEQDATELVAKLRAYHNTSQLQEDKVARCAIVSVCDNCPQSFWLSASRRALRRRPALWLVYDLLGDSNRVCFAVVSIQTVELQRVAVQ